MTQTANGKPRRYASNAIQQRRERIVSAVRALIVENGLDGFTLAEVAQRARVAERTIYNIGKNRQALVALAVKNYQEELSSDRFTSDGYNLEDVFDSLREVSENLLPERRWAETIAWLYFSGTTDADTYVSLVSISESHLVPAIDYYQARGELSQNAPLALITCQFTDTAFAILNDWALGRIADEQFSGHLEFALLASLVVVTDDPTRRELITRLEQLGAVLHRIRG